MADSSELDALQDGLASPFWQWFTSHMQKEWGAAGDRYQQAVMNAAAMKDENAVHTLRMVIFARQEIERLFQAPQERLRQLRGERAAALVPSTPSRRGPGL